MDFQDLFNNAPCGLVTYRSDGTITNINQTLLGWLGRNTTEPPLTNFFDLFDKGGKLYYQLFVQPSLKMHDAISEISLQIHTADGSFPCLFNALVSKTNGETIYASIFKITDRKKFENELLLKRSRVEEEKKAKAKALEEVAFDQAHLVRAPLANILGLISLLNHADVDADTKNLISLLNESSMQLDEIVKQIVNKTYQ